MLLVLLNLAAAVALLVWSIRMIRTGVERGSLPRLRRSLQGMSGHVMRASFGGAMSAMIMQSSTAVALIATGFSVSGLLSGSASLAMILGAELGSALTAWILFLPVQKVVPFLILVGVIAFLRSKTSNLKQAGRIFIGLAFVLMSIGMIRQAIDPLHGSEFLNEISRYLEGDLVSAFLFSAALAWLMHSSLATVITIASFAASGVLPPIVALSMVLGANFGGSFIALGLVWSSHRTARIIVLANVLARGTVTFIGLGFLIQSWDLRFFTLDAGQLAIAVHVLVNAVLLLWLPFVEMLINAANFMVPKEQIRRNDRLTALDNTTLNTPSLALACAQRELVFMFENMQLMLSQVMSLFRTFDPELVRAIERWEKSVDKSHFELKLFLAKLRAQSLSDTQHRKTVEMIAIANCLEEAADRISSNLVSMASKMAKENYHFSAQGMEDIEQFHDHVMANGQLAFAVMTTGDVETARLVLAEKDRIRTEEQELQERHLMRLQSGSRQSRATTNGHQETLRVLKHINAAISYVAYPIVQEAGDLLNSRLVQDNKRSSSVGV